MEPQLDVYERLKQCTVKILLPGKAGIGFFVGPGLILTCAHVVEDASINSSVEVYWDDPSHSDKPHPAQIMSCDHLADLALLRADLSYNPCVLLDEEAEPFDHLYSYGYPNDRPQGDSATFILEGKAGELREELKLKEGQVRPGLSGTPLLNLETGYVCGVMRLTRNRETDLGGRGISTTRVFETFPNFKTRRRELHPRVRRWTSIFKQSTTSTLEESNRQQMLRRVYDKWIADYLEKSLHPATTPIKLRLRKEPNALSRLPRLPQERNRPVDFFPAETTIREVYEKADGQLLIVRQIAH